MGEVTVKDLVADARVTETIDGFMATRHFMVSGLTGSADSRYFAALVAPDIPSFNDAHPGNGALLAIERTAALEGIGIARVSIVYRPATAEQQVADDTQLPTIEVGATVQVDETNVDVNGEALEVIFNQTDVDEDGTATVEPKEQTGTVEKQLPQVTMTFSRKEEDSPHAKAIIYVGTLNEADFYLGAPQTWMCTGIRGSSTDGGETYNVTYDFQHDKDEWKARVVYIDPDTGFPPKKLELEDPSQADATKEFQLYPVNDFANLNLGTGA